jgi:hypothetical protein
MHKPLSLTVGVLLFASACASSNSPNKVVLTGAERAEAVSIAERRQQLAIDRQKAAAIFNETTNRITEEETQLNLRSLSLCFTLKKSHNLDTSTLYQLNEYRGELVKRGEN